MKDEHRIVDEQQEREGEHDGVGYFLPPPEPVTEMAGDLPERPHGEFVDFRGSNINGDRNHRSEVLVRAILSCLLTCSTVRQVQMLGKSVQREAAVHGIHPDDQEVISGYIETYGKMIKHFHPPEPSSGTTLYKPDQNEPAQPMRKVVEPLAITRQCVNQGCERFVTVGPGADRGICHTCEKKERGA